MKHRRKKYDGFEDRHDSEVYQWMVAGAREKPGHWFSQSELSSGTNYSRSATSRHCRELFAAGHLELKRVGNRKLYRVSPDVVMALA
jgi:DNA-binding transcriptional ArsR family regulator